MRRKGADVSKRALWLLVFALGSSACVIGPKHDDPVNGSMTASDTGVVADEDTGDRGGDDSGVGAVDSTTMPPSDAGATLDGASSDGASSDTASSSDGASSDTASSSDSATSIDGAAADSGDASSDASEDAKEDASDAVVEGG
jgi:hypothetical protein